MTPRHGLPRHLLLRLAALDMVRVMVEQTREVLDAKTEDEAGPLLARIERERDKAFALTAGGDRLDLSGDDASRYRRQIGAMCAEVSAGWRRDIPAHEFVASVLALVARAGEQLPRTPEYMEHRYAWGRLEALTGELYGFFDPDLTDTAGIDHGERIAERMA